MYICIYLIIYASTRGHNRSYSIKFESAELCSPITTWHCTESQTICICMILYVHTWMGRLGLIPVRERERETEYRESECESTSARSDRSRYNTRVLSSFHLRYRTAHVFLPPSVSFCYSLLYSLVSFFFAITNKANVKIIPRITY